MNFIELLKEEPVYPGYPMFQERTKMSLEEFEAWVDEGRPAGAMRSLYGHFDRRGSWAVAYDGIHPKSIDWFTPATIGQYVHDASGRPLHPYTFDILRAGLGIEGPGAYRAYGPNTEVYHLVFGVGSDGRLRVLVAKRRGEDYFKLPGGTADDEKDLRWAARSRTYEQVGTDPCDSLLGQPWLIHTGIVPDARTTLNAWTEAVVWGFYVKVGTIDEFRPVARGDVVEAKLARVDDGFFNWFAHPLHGDWVRRGMKAFELEIARDLEDTVTRDDEID